MYPLLSLSQISIDPNLARRLPRRLAYYHLALPIAEDGEDITLAMAYPDNQRVIEVIRSALNAVAITPVRSHGEEIRRVLDSIWEQESETRPSSIVYWSSDPDQRPALQAYAQQIAAALSIDLLDALYNVSLEAFIDQVQLLRPALAICAAPDLATSTNLIARLPTSLLLLRGAFTPPRHILHALRGHTPDQRVLDWIIPLAQNYNAQITLLAVATSVTLKQGNPLISDFARLILPGHPGHVVEYGQMLTDMKLRGRIKIADGLLQDVMIDALENVDYDLVAIATENNGKFIQGILERLTEHTRAFLIIKP